MLATSECEDDGVAELVISAGEKVIELPVLVESVTESVSSPIVSIQPAGVGGTGPKDVPICGACRVLGRIAGVRRCLENLSDAPLALWDLEEDGGGPGGGPGKGMPGSQVACRVGDLLPDLLLVLEETPPVPMALVDTALLDAGGTRTACAVFWRPAM